MKQSADISARSGVMDIASSLLHACSVLLWRLAHTAIFCRCCQQQSGKEVRC
jgi:hypothetical protein